MSQEQKPAVSTGLNTVAIVALVVIFVLMVLVILVLFPDQINILIRGSATPTPTPTPTPLLTIP